MLMHSTQNLVRNFGHACRISRYVGQTLGRTDMAKQRIKLIIQEIRPNDSVPYCAGRKACKFGNVEIDKMLCMKIVEPAHSEWAPPKIFVRKSDGLVRFCTKYKKVNAVTFKDAYPILEMENSSTSWARIAYLRR